jgi:hypothetical protein
MTSLPPIDPVLSHVAAASVALVLVLAALAKLKDVELFGHALAAYELLPERWLPWVARALPLLELAAGLLLLPLATRPLGAALALAALGLATLALLLALRAGRTDIDCGCGGASDGQGPSPSPALVLRNCVLLALAALALVPAGPRATTALDVFAALAAALFTLGLYATTNQLLANRPRLHRLRALQP